MNFNEWYKWSEFEENDNLLKGYSRDGWKACKKQVLKILNKNILQDFSKGDIVLVRCIREIEEL